MKRLFDLAICLATAPVWVPVMGLCALCLLLFEGRPVFYVSERRVFRKKAIRILKFRAMVRDADKVANRNTIDTQGVRFLNIPADSPLYTPIGRLIEKVHFTELPQVLHVLRGDMSIIGNRPLPENVISALREKIPHAEDRFASKCGITGPVQLVGRNRLTDEERLELEIEYCRLASQSYSMTLDVLIFVRTVLSVLGVIPFLTPRQTLDFMSKFDRTGGAGRPTDNANAVLKQGTNVLPLKLVERPSEAPAASVTLRSGEVEDNARRLTGTQELRKVIS
jgi:lipopolysaccharide/colanic/teichoic acid biosynthesis glycosyltransferase